MPEESLNIAFLGYFSVLPDPRQERKVQYPLLEILLLVLCAVISGAESWVDIADYGNSKLDFLRRFAPFSNGIPSHDTLGEVFAKLSPKAFQDCFVSWVQSLREALPREIIALDGKTLRRSFDKASGQSAIHLVSAWASTQEMVLAQQMVDSKSNEITAIPKLLEMLTLKGAIVTIDAMGCQREIAKAIVKRKADYVLALKGNQAGLFEDARDFLEHQLEQGFRHSSVDRFETLEKGHGRIERRRYYSTRDVEWLKRAHNWPHLKSIALVEASRTVNGQTSREKRIYLSSLPQDAQLLAQAIRGHWGIENKLHWVLDVVFREDECRVRKDHSPRNFSMIRQISLNLIRKAPGKRSLRRKRKLAGWEDPYLVQVLQSA